MNAELLSVGTEILLGEILNTDAQFLSQGLSKLGIDTFYETVVGDNKERLKDALELSLSRADIVIASGGLGPTPDDLTKEVIAEVMGEKLVLHEESLKRMKEYFKKSNREMPESNKKQAMMPENSIILENNCGTAPGCIIEKDGKIVIMLPGPPNELTAMYEESVEPYLLKLTEQKLFTKTFHIFGIGESKVAEMFSDLMEKGTNPSVAPYAKTSEVHLRLAIKAKDESEAKELMSETENRIKGELGDYIYSEDGKNLNEALVNILKENNHKISVAESCTGGLLAKLITDVSGASQVFLESYVTYSNEAKQKILGVSGDTLKNYGAVSEQTAREMAEGVKKISGADIGVGITGVAGPKCSEKKPVGLVYIAISTDDETEVIKLNLTGNRDRIRYVTCLNVFDRIRRKYIK